LSYSTYRFKAGAEESYDYYVPIKEGLVTVRQSIYPSAITMSGEIKTEESGDRYYYVTAD